MLRIIMMQVLEWCARRRGKVLKRKVELIGDGKEQETRQEGGISCSYNVGNREVVFTLSFG